MIDLSVVQRSLGLVDDRGKRMKDSPTRHLDPATRTRVVSGTAAASSSSNTRVHRCCEFSRGRSDSRTSTNFRARRRNLTRVTVTIRLIGPSNASCQ